MIIAVAYAIAASVIVGIPLFLAIGGDESTAHASHRTRALASTSHENDRESSLARWNCGERSGRDLEYAEGDRYILGIGDRSWTEGLMSSDDRIRRWNRKPPRGMALSMRRD